MFRTLGHKVPERIARRVSNSLIANKFYSTPQRRVKKPEELPKIRYFAVVILASFGLLHFVTTQVDKKAPKVSFTEREFQQYEKETGLKRRHKLISHEKNEQYEFYAVPFAHDISVAEKVLGSKFTGSSQVKTIDPASLIEKEIEDEGKYSYLLQELKATKKSFPRGLITALVKQEIELFMNTTKGQFDTKILLMNYPQTTEEAIKFENDVSELKTCVVLEHDFENLTADLEEDEVRKVKNVVGYFDTVGKVQKVGASFDVLE